MPRLLFLLPRLLGAMFAAVALLGCRLLEDNGTHLAYTLEKAAQQLREANTAETVVRYETLDGPRQAYYVEITPKFDEGRAAAIWSSYLVVSGKTSGGTGYHNRFVFVPRRLYLEKPQGGPTEIVLRRAGDRSEVVELR